MVKKTNADFGVAYDGDGDRSIFCDEKGTYTGVIKLVHIDKLFNQI